MPDYQSLIGAIDAAEANSYGSDEDGDLSNERARNIDYYLGKNVEPAPDGRSQVNDRSVYDGPVDQAQPCTHSPMARRRGGDLARRPRG